MGWTVIDFLTARNLDRQSMVAVHLPAEPGIPLYSYHATASPPGRNALGMLHLLRAELNTMLAGPPSLDSV